ncbi:TOM1-like protein 2 [Culicoides brevitarsis]|uniref:TOM1-like protein 2 n=1 Tax=Culicoides brevitarsis TaxID=469753 RepID=UPI00307BD3D3
MASLLNQLNSTLNPFSTVIGQKIEQATDANLPTEDWALNMEICDLINESSDVAKDAVKAIRKRLNQNAGKNYTVIKYTLTVLETCVKNCEKPFHVLICSKEFCNDLVKLIGPKNGPPGDVQDKVLSLIQIWADAFRSQPDLKGVSEVYEELRSKGIEFPPTDLDSLAPIYTPQRSVPEEPHSRPSSSPSNHPPPQAQQHPPSPAMHAIPTSSPGHVTPEQLVKLQSELEIVQVNLTIFSEMLAELKPGQEDPSEYQLLTELAATCKEMRGRIVELIGKVNNDEITAELLRLNDELNNAFLIYARYEKNRDPKAVQAPSAILGAALGVGPKSAAQKELIDLSGEASGGSDLTSQLSGLTMGTASSQLSKLNSVQAQSGAKDEFDLLAQSRKGSGDAAKAPSGGSTAVGSLKDNEIDEMEAWLGKSGPTSVVGGGTGDGEESLTSKEFDKFLAERAAAAENLPNVTNNSGTPRKKKAEEQDLLS